MAINAEVFRAILAMDSYNRGYLPGIALSGTELGAATIRTDIALPTGSQVASFFAQAYTWNGHTVISYRGTDQAGPSWQNWTLGDVLNGWHARPARSAAYPRSTERRCQGVELLMAGFGEIVSVLLRAHDYRDKRATIRWGI